jgi:hypothetical protein
MVAPREQRVGAGSEVVPEHRSGAQHDERRDTDEHRTAMPLLARGDIRHEI